MVEFRINNVLTGVSALKQGGSGAPSFVASPAQSPAPVAGSDGGVSARHLSPLVKQRREQLAWQVCKRVNSLILIYTVVMYRTTIERSFLAFLQMRTLLMIWTHAGRAWFRPC